MKITAHISINYAANTPSSAMHHFNYKPIYNYKYWPSYNFCQHRSILHNSVTIRGRKYSSSLFF